MKAMQTNNIALTGTFILKMLAPFRPYLVALVLIGLLLAIDVSFRPYLIKIIINKVSVTAPGNVISVILLPLCIYLIASILTLAVFRSYDLITLKLTPQLKQNIIEHCMNLVMNHSHSYFQNNSPGNLQNKIKDISEGINESITLSMNRMMVNFFALIIASVSVAFIQIILGILLISWAAIYLLIAVKYSKTIHNLSATYAEANSRLSGIINDILSNMLVIRLFFTKKHEQQNVKFYGSNTIKAERKVDWFLFTLWTFQGLLFVCMEFISILLLLSGYKYGYVSVGDFAMVLIINVGLANCLWLISQDYSKFTEQIGKVTQGLGLIAVPTEIQQTELESCMYGKGGDIQFKEVQFCYPDSNFLLQINSLTIPKAQKLGLVGYSGSGKSTFVNLICRLYYLQEGNIFIFGDDITKLSPNILYQIISVIPQDSMLFHRSIEDNIKVGNLNASFEEIVAAAKKARAHDFIMQTPNAYQTVIGERGLKLSLGQRQRITIARAFLKNAPILILDEATSALDACTEELIRQSLAELMQDRTTIIISHRLSTLQHMDRILVFENGRIIQDGNHTELIRQQGKIYHKLWEIQHDRIIDTVYTDDDYKLIESIS